MDKILEADIIKRANSIYDYMQKLIKEYKPEKWYNSQLEFIINDDKEINGKAWCENDIDHIEVNSGVISLYYDYFSIIMEQDKVEILRILTPEIKDDNLKQMSYEGIIYKNGAPIIFDSKLVDDSKAKLLEIFVSRFIVTHEFGHVLNGHCNFLASISQNKFNFIPMHYFSKGVSITP